MHDGMPYDPIQGQGRGAPEVPKIALLKVYLLCHLQWELADDHRFLNYSTLSKFDQAGVLIFVLASFCVTWPWTWRDPWLVRPQKSFSDFSEIWYIDRGRWLMHSGMPHDPIQVKVKVTGFWSSENCTFLGLSPPPFTVGAGKWPLIFKLQHNI